MNIKSRLRLLIITLTLFVLCSFSNQTQAQNISRNEKIFVWMKTWNFLKYYHPALAGGTVDADSFFRAKLPSIEKMNNWADYNAFLLEEIQNIKAFVPKKASLSMLSADQLLKINPQHKWYLKNQHISKALKQQLLTVFNYRDPSKLHYIPKINFETKIPNEKEYVFPDSTNLPADLRLLALAKLQGVMDYLYPHQNLMSQTSDQIILQMIPNFEHCASRKAYEILLLKIVANLRDTHAYNSFYSDLKFKNEIFNNTFYPPFDYEILEDKILVTGIILPEVCASAGIQKGDLIENINGESVAHRITKLTDLLSASNRNALMYNLNKYSTNFIWSNTQNNFVLKLNREGKSRTLAVKFVPATDQMALTGINQYFQKKTMTKKKTTFEILDGGIAYFNIDLMHLFVQENSEKNFDQLIDSVFNIAAKQKGMVFDMRGYPHWGGLIYHYLPQKFSKDENKFAKYIMSDVSHLGTFKLNDIASTYNSADIKLQHEAYTGNIMILVNSATLSMSEWQTMSLQHIFPQAITIGTQSAGADGDEKEINIPGNYKINFTGNAIYYPDGTAAQGKGVKIDKVVQPEISDLLNDKDTILNQAIKLIN